MTGQPPAGERGIALLVVLAVLGGISMSAIMVAANSKRITGEAVFVRDDLVVRQAEMAALDVFSNRLSSHESGQSFVLNLDGIQVSVRVRPESAKLDLNHASEFALSRFFTFFLNDPDLGVRLASSVADWRDQDDLTRLNGAEANAYRAAGLGTAPRNGPFESVQELRGVLGVNQALFDCIQPLLSVQSGTEVPDTRTASPILVRALGLVPEVASAGGESILTPLGTRSGDVFEVAISVEIGGGKPKSNSVYIVRSLGDQRAPYAIIDRQPADERAYRSQLACASLGIAQGNLP